MTQVSYVEIQGMDHDIIENIKVYPVMMHHNPRDWWLDAYTFDIFWDAILQYPPSKYPVMEFRKYINYDDVSCISSIVYFFEEVVVYISTRQFNLDGKYEI